jgi:hypothetical protein
VAKWNLDDMNDVANVPGTLTRPIKKMMDAHSDDTPLTCGTKPSELGLGALRAGVLPKDSTLGVILTDAVRHHFEYLVDQAIARMKDSDEFLILVGSK